MIYPSQTLGKFLKNRREELNLTQRQVANRLKYSASQYVSGWEKGTLAPPVAKIPALVKALKLDRKKFASIVRKDTMRAVQAELSRIL